jgi:type IV/VI secretion system ImpK/VasF family protein
VWVQIAALFTEVDELCIDALAAELVLQRVNEEERMVRAMGQRQGSPGTAPTESPKTREELRYPQAVQRAKDPGFREQNTSGADLVRTRDRMRKLLLSLKKELSYSFNEREVFQVLLPIVIYCDELVRGITRGAVLRWEPLQSELLNIDNGGELFFWSMEDRLRESETPPLVLEVYYFCLSDGFEGMYQGDRAKIADCKDRLKKRIPSKSSAAYVAPKESKGPLILPFPWKYYAMAAGTLVGVYILLRWIGSALS